MDFELAYDLEVEPDKEVVFVLSHDRNRKVRVLVTESSHSGDSFAFRGNSLGSSVREIKSTKKDEPPVLVTGRFEKLDGEWKGTVTMSGSLTPSATPNQDP